MLQMKIDIDPGKTDQNLAQVVQEVQQKIALDLLTGIVLGTPVDEGRAAGNWQVTIGAPAPGTLDVLDPTKTSTIASGSGVILTSLAFTTIYIVNNLPYIQPLERGHSGQAPQGMVQINVDRVAGAFG